MSDMLPNFLPGLDGTAVQHAQRAHNDGATTQTGSPVPLRLVASTPERTGMTEQALHQRFRAARRHGEWFALNAAEVGALAREMSA